MNIRCLWRARSMLVRHIRACGYMYLCGEGLWELCYSHNDRFFLYCFQRSRKKSTEEKSKTAAGGLVAKSKSKIVITRCAEFSELTVQKKSFRPSARQRRNSPRAERRALIRPQL